MSAPAKARKRTVYVKAAESRPDKIYKWVARLWPVIIGLGVLLWTATSEWHSYSELKITVTDPKSGLVKKVDDLGEGQKETHSLVRDLATQVNKIAAGSRH